MDYRHRSVRLNDLDLNKLHVFRSVAESASMREAGEKLLRTPSAVSQSISSLERALGVQLFVRQGIRLKLTDVGGRMLEQVRSNERGLEALLEEVRGAREVVRGRVAIGMPPGYPAVSLSEPLSRLLATHPELQLRLRFHEHAKLAELLSGGALDMALSLQPLRRWNRTLKSVKLRDERLVLAVPSRHRYLLTAALTELPVVDYYQKPSLIDGWLKHHGLRRVQPRIRVFASNLDHVLQLVLRGVGCAVVPRHVIASHLAEGKLLEHPVDRRDPWLTSVWLNALKSESGLTAASRAVRAGLIA